MAQAKPTTQKPSTHKPSSHLHFGTEEHRLSYGGHDSAWFEAVVVDPITLTTWTRQFSTMLESGIHILAALEFLGLSQSDLHMAEVCLEMHHLLAKGASLSTAVRKFPRVFPRVFIALVKVGEETGGLVVCLRLLADWLEKDTTIRRRIRSSLTYPAVVLVLSLLLAALLFYGILPPFLQMLVDSKVELPLPTRILWTLAQLSRNPLFLVVLALVVTSAGYLAHRGWQNPSIQLQLYTQLGRLPIVGSWLREQALQKISAAGDLMCNTGCSALKMWELALKTSNDPRHQLLAGKLTDHLSKGGEISSFTRRHPSLFDRLFVQSLAVAEESGQFGKMFHHLQLYYEIQLEERREALLNLLQPVVLLTVGLSVLGCLLSVFIPLYSHLSKL